MKFKLSGARNFRDLGGIPSADGRRIRYGMLFRSESLSKLTPEDFERLQVRGIRLVCDLRGKDEKRRAPTSWPDGAEVETLHMDVNEDVRAGSSGILARIAEDPTPERATHLMLDIYRSLPEAFTAHLPVFFQRALDRTGTPLIFHCTAGKDRTGFLTSILLHALGVPKAEIFADYLKTSEYISHTDMFGRISEVLKERHGITAKQDLMEPIVMVEPYFLDAAWDVIDQRWGSIDNYLLEVGLVDQDVQEALRDKFLEYY